MDGIKRFVRLIMDPKAARDLEKDSREALDKGTDPKTPTKNLKAVEQGVSRLRQAAVALGTAFAAAFTVRAIGRFLTSSLRAADELRKSRDLLRQTVENEGTAWENVAYQVDQVTKALWETHRLTEGEVNPILRTLITVTGDYENSLKAVGLAADLAAAANMDQVTAARLLGRVLRGETNVLNRYGIEISDGADAVQVLTERLQGMAAAGAPATVQLTKAWGDFKEALGEALIDASSGENIVERLTIAIRNLTRFISENADTWQRWGVSLISAIERTFGFLSRFVDSTRIGMVRLRIQLLETQRAFNQLWASISPVPRVRQESRQAIQEISRDIQRLNALLLDLTTPRRPQATPTAPSIDLGLPEIKRQVEEAEGEIRRIGGVQLPGLLGLGRTELDERRHLAFVQSLAKVSTELADAQAAEAVKRQQEALQRLQDAAEDTAHNMTNAFAGFFEGMAQGFMGMLTLGEALKQGVTGLGAAIIEELTKGKVEYHMAEGAGALASGTWPPNPLALKAASQHFIAAGLFKALPGVVRSMGRPSSGGRMSIPSATAATRPSSIPDRQQPEINIYIDPLNPTNPAWQSNLAQTLRGVTQRYGSATVNVRPRTA